MEQAYTLAQHRKSKAFEATYALILYGIILFPSCEGFIDMNAIKIFLTRNPVPTLLANTFHTVHAMHVQLGGVITCCLPMLYRWFCSYLPSTPAFWDHHDGLSWPQKIMALTHTDIVWANKLPKNSMLISSCGEFFNVPLLGVEGGVSYNPILARRQFGYPNQDEPQGDQVEPIFFRLEGNEGLKTRTLEAWTCIRKLGKKSLGKRDRVSSDVYLQWVRRRAAQIKMPYHFQVATDFDHPALLFLKNRGKQARTSTWVQPKVQAWENKYEILGWENKELRGRLSAEDREYPSYGKEHSQENTPLASTSAKQPTSPTPSMDRLSPTDESTLDEALMELYQQGKATGWD